jgi:Kef-type K+ transport system membrane component KefB
MRSTFLPYEEPTTIQLLILGSFLLFLPISQRVFQRVLSAGILGPLAVGVIYGVPLANILPHVWQEAYLVLGYLGLILIVFEGGLSTRLDLLRDNLPLSLTCALTGICCPIALSFAILTPGYQYPLVESFILGAALSATSLGTTFAILGSLGGTRVGTIAMSAAMIDDVVGCE